MMAFTYHFNQLVIALNFMQFNIFTVQATKYLILCEINAILCDSDINKIIKELVT